MSSSTQRTVPRTTQEDWLSATSNALTALLSGVVLFALFQMLLTFIKQASTFSCPAGPTFTACKFVKEKVIFTVKR